MIKYFPVYQWTHREFDGVDPWANNQPVRWRVIVYRMVEVASVGAPIVYEESVGASPAAAQIAPTERNDVPKKFAVGIFAEVHNRYRVLPLALQDLWRARHVRDEDLPWLLNRIEQLEQPLRRNDYPPNFVRLIMFVYSVVFGLLAVAGLGFFVFFAPSAKLVTQSTDAGKWVGQPVQPDRKIYVLGEIPIAGMVRLRTPVTPPASLHFRRNGDKPSILAVVQAASEKRLALVTGKYDLINSEGVVIRTHAAGIPVSALSELKKSYPDLNTDFVFCPGCYTISPYHPATFALALWGGAVSGLIFLISLSVYLWWRRRRQSQAEAWLDLLRARSAGVTA